MIKIQFGSGGNNLDGWINLEEHQCDITKTLPFEDESVDFILVEHVVEHIHQIEAYKFFKEAYRILKLNGVIRIIVPDIMKIYNELYSDREARDRYLSLIREGSKTWWKNSKDLNSRWQETQEKDWNPGISDALETMLFCHGHKTMWSQELLIFFLDDLLAFETEICEYQKSKYPELNNIDSHWKYAGLENVILESLVIEATK